MEGLVADPRQHPRLTRDTVRGRTLQRWLTFLVISMLTLLVLVYLAAAAMP